MQGPVSPSLSPGAQPSVGAASLYGMTQLSSSAPAYGGPYSPLHHSAGPSSTSQLERVFPVRPGQPECQYYMKTGDCKYGSSCKFHHPPDWAASLRNCVLSSAGLPLRPVHTFHPLDFLVFILEVELSLLLILVGSGNSFRKSKYARCLFLKRGLT